MDSDRKLAQLRSTSSTSLLAGEKPGEGTARMAVRPAGVGGLVRVVEERPGQLDDEQWQPGGQGSKVGGSRCWVLGVMVKFGGSSEAGEQRALFRQLLASLFRG